MSGPLTLKISEIFSSFQGEGIHAGAPSTFLRLATCNLRCRWCDTPYSWDFVNYDYDAEVRELRVRDVLSLLPIAPERRLVVTGGEPLLQQRQLENLFDLLPQQIEIDVETNGTVIPLPALLHRVQHFSVSVKLENSGEPLARRLRPKALESLRDSGKAWLKLVVQTGADCAEAEALATELDWPKKRVLLMPEAQSRSKLSRLTPLVTRESLLRGLGTSPRLHVERWGGRRGV